MKPFFFIAALLFLNSCSTYSPVAIGKGQYSGKHIKGCSEHFFGLTSSPENTRLDNVLNKHGIDSSEVYSVEKEFFHFLFPIFAQTCTYVTLNSDGVESYLKRKKANQVAKKK